MTSLRAAVLFCMISVCLGCKIYKDPSTEELKSNLECECGVRNAKNTRIVNGVDSAEHEFPWQVWIWLGKYRCGGSIISSKTILTAAHCLEGVDDTKIWAVIGEHNIVVPHDGEQWIKICDKIIHPNWNKKNLQYDFAILTLCTEIDFTKEISPICLPSMGSKEDGSPYENIDAIVTGWGFLRTNGTSPDILQKTDVQTMTNIKCCTNPNLYACSQIKDSMMCGTWTNNKVSGFCDGDSGGPLITKEGDGYSLIGVVSFSSDNCAQYNVPYVYARVTMAKQWITENIKGSICKRRVLPAECKNYKILDEESRSSLVESENPNKVDTTSVTSQVKSPKWEGPAWYRIQNLAGTKLAGQQFSGNCDSIHPVWMRSQHPTTVGTTKAVQFCVGRPGYRVTCWTHLLGKVTHCGDYFVYHLPDLPPFFNHGRYCSAP